LEESNFILSVNLSVVAFADADIGRPEFPTIFRTFSFDIFDKIDRLFANGAIHRKSLF